MKSATLALRLTQLGVVLVFLGLGLFYARIAPFSEGPDEVAHFQFIRFWAKHHYLPITAEDRAEAGYKSDWPPLFHWLAGVASRGIDLEGPPFIKVAQNNPRLQLVVGLDNIISWRALTTEDPLQSETLLWYVGRWVTLLCGLAGVMVTYWLVQRVYPGFPWLALGTATLLAFLPLYLTISSLISYEPLLGAFIGLYLLLWYLILQQPERNVLYLALGGLMGLAGLTKYTPLTAAPLLPLFIIWLAYRHGWSWQVTLWRLLLAGLGLTFTFGLWFFYVAYQLNRIAELGWVEGLTYPFLTSDGSDATSLRLAGLLTGKGTGGGGAEYNDTFLIWFWRLTDWGMGWLTGILWILWGLALVGLIRRWPEMEARRRLWVILLIGHIFFFSILLLLRFVLSWQAATGMGQHFLFPAGAAVLLLTIEGLKNWLKPGLLTKLLWLTAALALGQTVTLAVQNEQAPWPVQSVPVTSQEQVLAAFGEMALLDYRYEISPETLGLTLQWRTEALMNEDYQVELTLIDGAGQPQARWAGQPVNGRYPTRAWAVGDRLRDQIYLPVTGLPAGTYQPQLRVLKESGPIPTTGGEAFRLRPVALAPSPDSKASTLWLEEEAVSYTLWEKGQPATEMADYGENAIATFTIEAQKQALPGDIQVKLVGPEGQAYPPLEQTGRVYNFRVEPRFASGAYHLRLERWQGEQLVAQAETPALLQVTTEERQFALKEGISQPVSANFAGYITLLGYDLPQRQVQPGEQISLTLQWQALKTIGANLIMFSHLIDEKGQIWGGHDRLIREIYSTMLWAPGEIVTDPLAVAVDPAAPDGIYYLLVGLYLPVGQSSVSVPLLQDGKLSEITHVRIGPIKVGRTPTGLTVTEAQPQVPLSQSFGDPASLTLLGYDLIQPGESAASGVKLRLYWQAEAPMDKDYTTFVHLRNAQGETVIQQDQPPLKGVYPTSLWSPGEIIVDEIILPVTLPLPAGQYQIVVGLYDFNTGQRLPIQGEGHNEVRLANFDVKS